MTTLGDLFRFQLVFDMTSELVTVETVDTGGRATVPLGRKDSRSTVGVWCDTPPPEK